MLKFSLQNFRGFSDEPISLDLSEKFISIVGPNNSGKSTVLRSLYELRQILAEFQHINRFFNNPEAALESTEIFSRNNSRGLEIEVEYIDEETTSATIRPANRTKITINRDGSTTSRVFHGTTELDKTTFSDPQLSLKDMMHGFSIISSSIYAGPFRNVISVTPSAKYYDLDIGSYFIDAFDNMRSGKDPHRRYEVRKLIEEIREIFGLGQLGITTSSDKKTLNVDLENGSFTISELGTGLSQFLILLLHVTTYKPKLLLIDEPEMNLHPRLQVELLQVLGRYCDVILFASHNIGLTRTLSNTRYITEKRGVKNVLRSQQAYPRLPELLGEMNYSGQHELLDGVAAVLFVEGPSDVPVFRSYLKLIHRADKVLVLSLNGEATIRASRVEELHELKRVSSKVAVIIDSERTYAGEDLSKTRKEFIEACVQAEIECHVLEFRAIENYFTRRAIVEAFGTEFQSLGPYQKLSEAKKPWAKSKNMLIAEKMNAGELANAEFFSFLQRLDIVKDSTLVANLIADDMESAPSSNA